MGSAYYKKAYMPDPGVKLNKTKVDCRQLMFCWEKAVLYRHGAKSGSLAVP